MPRDLEPICALCGTDRAAQARAVEDLDRFRQSFRAVSEENVTLREDLERLRRNLAALASEETKA